MKPFPLLLIISAFASEENIAQNEILIKIEEDVYNKNINPKYIGVYYRKQTSKWRAQRYSPKDTKYIYNGHNYKDEETAAHASDTLARKLLANGEKGHTLNFPEYRYDIEARQAEKTSHYIGVRYMKKRERWGAVRYSKNEKKMIFNGTVYKEEKTAARASDTLARKLIANGEKDHTLNFPNDDAEVRPAEKSSNYIGVSYNQRDSIWFAYRHNKKTNKTVHNGIYKDEKTAAHASDTLARKLIANGEKHHKLNFPDDAENQKLKRKRPQFDKFGSGELDKN